MRNILSAIYLLTGILLLVIAEFWAMANIAVSGDSPLEAHKGTFLVFFTGTLPFIAIGVGVWKQRRWAYASGLVMGVIFVVVHFFYGDVYSSVVQGYVPEELLIPQLLITPFMVFYLFKEPRQSSDNLKRVDPGP